MTAKQRERVAPTGHHWVWRPTEEAEPDHSWIVLSPGVPRRPCCYGDHRGPGCGSWSVARLSLAGPSERPRFVDYCEAHLFTRRIEDGVLWTCVLEPIGGVAA